MGNTQLEKYAIIDQCKRVVQYFDVTLAFHSTFNEPLQIIGIIQDQFLVFQIEFTKGKYNSINIFHSVYGESILSDTRLFEVLIEQNLDFIIRSWVDYFLYNKQPNTEIIEKRISIN